MQGGRPTERSPGAAAIAKIRLVLPYVSPIDFWRQRPIAVRACRNRDNLGKAASLIAAIAFERRGCSVADPTSSCPTTARMRSVARRFAEGFEAAGLEVWWDQALRSGEAYDKVTEAALRGAKAVVVLWSPRSVDSRWVRAEATIAERTGRSVPAKIEPCDLPVMFGLTQTADLSQWQGAADDKAWLAFLGDVRRMVGKDDAAAPSKAESAPAPVGADSHGCGVSHHPSRRRRGVGIPCRGPDRGHHAGIVAQRPIQGHRSRKDGRPGAASRSTMGDRTGNSSALSGRRQATAQRRNYSADHPDQRHGD